MAYIQRLTNDGHAIQVITSRFGISLRKAEEWIRNHNMTLSIVGVGFNKSKAGAAKGLDVYIDDDFEKLEPLVNVVPNLFLFSWAYNQHKQIDGVASRIASWPEFYATIQTL